MHSYETLSLRQPGLDCVELQDRCHKTKMQFYIIWIMIARWAENAIKNLGNSYESQTEYYPKKTVLSNFQ